MFSCPDGVSVIYRTHEYSSISDLACAGSIHDGLDGRLYELVTANDGDLDARDDVGTVHHSTVHPVLPVLADSLDLGIREPVDVCLEQGFFHILEFRFSDDCFDFLHFLKN